MWLRHWKLHRDPFADRSGPFVSTPVHAEAVARLVDAVASGRRLGQLRAPAGLGKSTVLARALVELHGPARRIARADAPLDGPTLFATLAERLGRRVEPGADRATAWRRLAEAARLCRWQGLGVVLSVDDCQHLADPADRRDLDRLVHLDPHPDARLTVLRVGRPEDDEAAPWVLAIRLAPLTRSEAEHYLAAKLADAGRDDLTFTPRAVTLLHAATVGNPRGLDRLASLALMAGALRGLEVVTPDVVEGASRECLAVDQD